MLIVGGDGPTAEAGPTIAAVVPRKMVMPSTTQRFPTAAQTQTKYRAAAE